MRTSVHTCANWIYEFQRMKSKDTTLTEEQHVEADSAIADLLDLLDPGTDLAALQERVRALEEIERRAIEQSEAVQRDWASPVEVAGMKKRIAELEATKRDENLIEAQKAHIRKLESITRFWF